MDADTTYLGAIGVVLLWILCAAVSLALGAVCLYYGAGIVHLGWKRVH